MPSSDASCVISFQKPKVLRSHGFWRCPLNTDTAPGPTIDHEATPAGLAVPLENPKVLHFIWLDFLPMETTRPGNMEKRKQGEGSKRKSSLPALAPATALEMALLEIALFRFMISSNSASLTVEGGGPESRLHRSNTSLTASPERLYHPLYHHP